MRDISINGGLKCLFQDWNVAFDLTKRSLTDSEFYTQFEFETFMALTLNYGQEK
jgi:hypothetical protein